jgi:hypothetical protein
MRAHRQTANTLRFFGRRRRGRRNGNVGSQGLKALRADPANGEQILYAPESAALLAHFDNPLRRDPPYAGQLLKLLRGRSV